MYELVLVGTDGSATASRAVKAAARLAHLHQARLTIVYAFSASGVDPHAADVPDVLPWLRTPGGAAEALVLSAVELAQRAACGSLDVTGRSELGNPRAVLRSVIAELQPDAVVVGNADARRSITRRGLGSWLAGRTRADVIIVDTALDRDPADQTRAA